MPQKKKTNKKSHKKKHLNPKQTIVYQSIPNYSSGQSTGHQNNKNVSFLPSVQQESRTDNLVGDLVSRLIGKIENDGNKQTQEYSKDIQPINNNNNGNNSVVNIYNDGIKKEDKKPDETPEAKTETIINNYGRSAAEDFGIQTAAGATGLLGVGALGVAYNSDAAAKAKLKLKKVGAGILGAVTSVGAAINNNILKRGTKLGGDKSTTNLIKEEGKLFEKKGKAGTYARLEDEMNPKITDLDAYMKKKHGHFLKPEVDEAITTPKQSITPKLKPLPPKQSIEPKPSPQNLADTPTPTPSKLKIDSQTPVPRMNLFSPAKNIANFKPQNILSPSLDISKTRKTNLMEPVEVQLEKMNARDKIKARIKMLSTQEQYKAFKEVNKEANKLQNAFRNFKAKKIVRAKREEKYNSPAPAKMEIGNTIQPARLSGVHETTRQGATTTRIHTQNQAIAQLRQQPPTRPSTGTAISNATTTTPQARGNSIKDLKPLPESEKRGRGRPLGSGAPKPMSIKYDKPGRPKLMPDPEGPAKKK